MGVSNDETAFVEGVSKGTGIDPRVLVAWDQVEGAYAPNGTGAHNYLNLRPYPGDPYKAISSGNFEQFGSVEDAVTATVRRLQMPFASGIVNAAKAKATPRTEIAAISQSNWDAGHYAENGGNSLANAFVGIFGGKNHATAVLDSGYVGPESAGGVAGAAGTGSAADAGSFDLNNAGDAAKNAVKAVTDPLGIGHLIGWISNGDNLIRIGMFLGGGIMLILGTYEALK